MGFPRKPREVQIFTYPYATLASTHTGHAVMSSQVRDSDEICENNNCDVKPPPELAIKLPSRKDIGATRVDWTTAESALLPIDVLLVTVKDYEHVNCYYYLKDTTRSWCHGLGMVDFGTFGDGGVNTLYIFSFPAVLSLFSYIQIQWVAK